VAPEKDTVRINERIRVREIRVIGADAEQLGVMTPEEALAIAREEGLDLVEVAANSRPPVCRIMDYGRYKYEQKKKTNKQSHTAALKEVKMRPGTDQHDLNFKLSNVRKFLIEGDKVKVTVMFRGREMVHPQRGRVQLELVMKQLGPLAKMENPPRMEGRFMSMIVIGDREAIAEYKKNQKNQEANPDDSDGSSEPEVSKETKADAPTEGVSGTAGEDRQTAVEDGQG